VKIGHRPRATSRATAWTKASPPACWSTPPRLIKAGVAPGPACRMALVRPITDDADIRATLDHAIDATFA
jgi:hypothetical protein